MSFTWDPRDFNKNLHAENKKLMLKSVLVVERNAKRRCPKKTSHLASTITHELKTDFGNFSGFILAGGESKFGTIVLYAIYVELGTKYFAGRFYMRGGLRESFPAIRQIWGIVR